MVYLQGKGFIGLLSSVVASVVGYIVRLAYDLVDLRALGAAAGVLLIPIGMSGSRFRKQTRIAKGGRATPDLLHLQLRL